MHKLFLQIQRRARQVRQNTGSGFPSGSSDNPVNYFSGVPEVVSRDLFSVGFGADLGQVRTWSDQNNTGQNGNGWVVTQNPYLLVYSTFGAVNPTIGINHSGYQSTQFDVPAARTNGTWMSRGTSQQKVSFDTVSLEWTVTDATGNKLVFYDLPRNGSGNLSTGPLDGIPNQGLPGKLKRRVDSNGFVTSYTYNGSGQVSRVERVVTATGAADRLTYLYSTVTNTLGGSASLLQSVAHTQRDTTGGTFNPVRAVVYSYYNGEGTDAAHGRLGDLKLATIRQGNTSGPTLERCHPPLEGGLRIG